MKKSDFLHLILALSWEIFLWQIVGGKHYGFIILNAKAKSSAMCIQVGIQAAL